MKQKLFDIFKRLYKQFGAQHWWPADTKDEVVIGAVLTQNTAWVNVERAIQRLRGSNLLTLESIAGENIEKLKECIKPAGFFNQKAEYLRNVAIFFTRSGGFEKLSQLDVWDLRRLLLNIKGIGKETADSIVLYAFGKPIFVVDAYTKRIVMRHNLSVDLSYDSIQKLFMENLPLDTELFGEYHALLVKVSKEYCKKRPLCVNCPLEDLF